MSPAAATLGGSSVTIHGLPILVLLDGRRLTDSAAEAGGGLQFTDVNLFPVGVAQTRGGAQGRCVGHLWHGGGGRRGQRHPRPGVRGLRPSPPGMVSQRKATSITSGTTSSSGTGDEKTHLVVAADYIEQDPIFDRDRAYAVANPTARRFMRGSSISRRRGRSRAIPAILSATRPSMPRSIPRSSAPTRCSNPVRSRSRPAARPSPAPGNPVTERLHEPGDDGQRFRISVAANAVSISRRHTSITLDQTSPELLFGSADRQLHRSSTWWPLTSSCIQTTTARADLNAQPLYNGTGRHHPGRLAV